MAKVTESQGRMYCHWKDFAKGVGMTIVYVETGTDKTEPHAVLKDEKGKEERMTLRMQQKLGMPSTNVEPIRSGTNG